MPNKGKQILAVWGSPSSGKTVTAVKIAKELSINRKNVAVVFCDGVCPALPTVLKTKKTVEGSIGEVLSAPSVTQELILKNCICPGKNPYISFLGYKAGENVFTYAEYAKERAVDLLVLLRHIADYVVVDCSSALTDSILSTAALEVADTVLRLGSCDLKSVSYYMSCLPLIADRRFKPEKHIRVLSNVKPRQDSGGYENTYGGVSYRLPHVAAIEEQFYSLALLDSLSGKEAKAYQTVILAITEEVFGNA
ncbi:MAG: ParA family protein [Candidatus Dehalobacter alkaniphilus]|uniref:ParA family protein n=1 Tax=Dehalobacter sp. DCM TaxID=2907827 RepID=UPI003081A755|nr:ParA family protein [Dehalobacter sp. DCM]